MTQEVYTDLEQVPHPSELSFGQKLVGLTSNPTGNQQVQRAKELCADLADLLRESQLSSHENGTATSMRELLTNNAYTEILNAQMNVVKVLTLK